MRLIQGKSLTNISAIIESIQQSINVAIDETIAHEDSLKVRVRDMQSVKLKLTTTPPTTHSPLFLTYQRNYKGKA
jgi:hypothetical protein